MTQYIREAYESWRRMIDIYNRAVATHWRGMPNHKRRRIIRIKRKSCRRLMRRLNKFGPEG